jgi:hypothetical protein
MTRPRVGRRCPAFFIPKRRSKDMAKIDFGGVIEEVITADEFTLEQARETLKNEVITILGYGVQGPGQALNLRDNGFSVIVGQREGTGSWQRAVEDGFVPGKTLLSIEDAARQGTVVQYLLSDAGQMALWPRVKPCLNQGDALYFSHGFGVVYNDQTGIVPPANVDVILVAPKGSGRTVRPISWPAAASTPASPSTRTSPDGPGSGPWRWGSPSAPAISFPPPSKKRSTAISPASAAF